MNRNILTIGLFGFGCVGAGLYEVLKKTPALKTSIKRICVKNRDKKRTLPAHYFTFDKEDILQDPDINVVVELIDDADAAFDIVATALKHRKAVVTANKKMIAEHLSELLHLQRLYDVPLLYEAACCASIPIIRNLEEYYDNDLLESFEGIVNGSTNYILTKTSQENISYDKALKTAQELGFAESDPTLDTEGYDAKYKLVILLAHAFGVVVQPEEIFNIGIAGISELELNFAREKELKIKLVAQAFKTENGTISAFVMPKFIGKNNKLFTVDDVFNGVITKTCFADIQFFSGKGAGAFPTASAVISDISALSYNYRYEYKKLNETEKLSSASEITLTVFLRHDLALHSFCQQFFLQIHETYFNRKNGYIIGDISLKNLIEFHHCVKGAISPILVDIPQSTQVTVKAHESKWMQHILTDTYF
jgi:homoserine dehydrogenase